MKMGIVGLPNVGKSTFFNKIAKKLSTAKKPKTSIKTKFLFSMMRMMQKAGMGSSETETKYWEEQGWLGSGRPWR